MAEIETLYIVEQARFSSGDTSGTLVTSDGEFLYSHMSSSSAWLRRDLTMSFGRGKELAERFPGHQVIYISGDEPLPEVLAPHFNQPIEETKA